MTELDVFIGVMIFSMTALLGSFLLIGYRMRLKNKGGGQVSGEDLDRLADTVDRLSDQVQQLSAETSALHERVDFAERLLSAGRRPGGVEPEVPTPV